MGEVYIYCWIGSSIVILKGTSISDNCVISSFIHEGSIVKYKKKYVTIPIKKCEEKEEKRMPILFFRVRR